MEFGSIVKQVRKELGLSQEQLARELSISLPISKQGGRRIGLIVFSRILVNYNPFFPKKEQQILVCGFIKTVFCMSLMIVIREFSIIA